MDFMSSKGIEYLMVIGYLLLFIPFWMVIERRARPARVAVPAWVVDPVAAIRGWFAVPDGLSYHRGHTWAAPVPGVPGRFRVGVDDFAQRLLGRPDVVELPLLGSRLAEGETGFRFTLDGRPIDLLSPLAGKVVAHNADVVADPARLCADPYGGGWLCEVEVPREAARATLKQPLAGAPGAQLDGADRGGAVRPAVGAAGAGAPGRWRAGPRLRPRAVPRPLAGDRRRAPPHRPAGDGGPGTRSLLGPLPVAAAPAQGWAPPGADSIARSAPALPCGGF